MAQRKARYRREFTLRIAKWLQTERNNLKVQEVAKLLNVSRRTLSSWSKQIEVEPRKVGRPSYGQKKKLSALLKVGREWKKQGCPGWRPIKAALGDKVPTRLIQLQIQNLKLLSRKRMQHKLKQNRLSIRVKHKDVLWSQDGAIFKNCKYQVIKDRASLKVLAVKKIEAESAENVINSLKEAGVERRLPFVISTDNGSNYISKHVDDFLSKNMVIHLKSLPRTPQHNGSVECAIRELKQAATLSQCSLNRAAKKINENRLRASFLFKPSSEIDDKMSEGYAIVARETFYKECLQRLKDVQARTLNSRSKRMLERKVILETLEDFNLIEINRGGSF